MTIKEAESAIKCGEPSALEQSRILVKAHNRGYICTNPACGSGSGRKGTGTEKYTNSAGHQKQKCFVCGECLNNLELIARHYGLDLQVGRDYYEAVQYGCEIFGLQLDETDNRKIGTTKPRRPIPKTNAPIPVTTSKESVADGVKERVNLLSATLLMKKGIFTDGATRYQYRFKDAVDFKNTGKGWLALRDNADLNIKQNAVYSTAFMLARYYEIPFNDEVRLYKKICEEFELEYKTFAQERDEENAAILKLIHKDIEEAVANIDNCPEDCRRGLPLDILKELRFGWTEKWCHPKHRLRPGRGYASRRLLATTPNHYEAMTPQADRNYDAKSAYWKMHTSPREPFFLDILKFGDINLVFEGAVNAASAYYSLDREYPCYATGGTSQYNIFVDKLKEMCKDDKPRFVIMYDSDEAGRKAAQIFAELMNKNGFLSVTRFLADAESDEDCNDILINEGKDKLAELLRGRISDVAKDFEESAKMQETQVSETMTEQVDWYERSTKLSMKTCPIDLQMPNGFAMDDEGIYRRVNTGKSTGFRLFCQTPIVITRAFFDKMHENGAVEIAVMNIETKRWHYHTYLTKVLASNSGILELASNGVAISQQDAKYLSKFLMGLLYHEDNFKAIPKRLKYEMPGWTSEDCEEFIFPYSADDKYFVGNGDIDFGRIFLARGDEQKWLSMFTKNILESYVVRLVCGLALAAPLILPCSVRNIQCHLCGRSGSGKTALLKLALSIYGKPSELMRSFNGTQLSLEKFAVYFNDFPHGVNEFQAMRRKAREEDTDVFIHTFDEGMGRSRLDKNANMRKVPRFRGCRITTGEQTLTQEFSGKGAFARVLEITDSNFLDDRDAVELHQVIGRGNYGHFGRRWIEYVVAYKSELVTTFEMRQFVLESLVSRAIPAHRTMVALAYTALEHFTAAFCDADTAAAVKEEIDRGDDYWSIFAGLPSSAQSDNVERARAALTEYLTSHASVFCVENEDGDWHNEDGRAPVLIGYKFYDGRVGFAPRELKKILEVEYKFPSADSILREFDMKDWILKGNDVRRRHQRRVRAGFMKTPVWLIIFQSDVLV